MKNHICIINLLHQNSTYCEAAYKVYHLLVLQGFTEHINGRNMDPFIPAWCQNVGQVITTLSELLFHQNSKPFCFFESETPSYPDC